MSYTITIGQAIVIAYDDELSIDVEEIELPEAPYFPYDVTGKTNSRSPAYLVWFNFIEQVELKDFFENDDYGLMRINGSGAFKLSISHLEAIKRARYKWQQTHHHEPGWDYERDYGSPDDGVRGRDAALARLLWLEWWVGWALNNCTIPALVYS